MVLKARKSYHLYFQNLRPKNFTIQDIIQKYLKKKNPHQKQRTSTYGNNLQLQYKTKKICCRALRYLISLNPAVINLPFISRQCYNLTFEMETNAMASWIRKLKIHLKSLHSIQSLRNLLTAARMLLWVQSCPKVSHPFLHVLISLILEGQCVHSPDRQSVCETR